jgi:hypothetical protein
MSYQSFKSAWIGKRVDYDKVEAFQCVDLIKQYVAQEFGLKPSNWGNAINYWHNTPLALLVKFDKLATNQARSGDIVIFKGINGSPYGHIGISDGNSGPLTITTLEQNGATGGGSGTGGDAIRLRAIPIWRVVGVLRPKTAQPAPGAMPGINSSIQLLPGTTRTVFKPGTTTVAKTIYAADGSYVYFVRGYDSAYPNRILISSAGTSCALALYYTNGVKIDGWKQL